MASERVVKALYAAAEVYDKALTRDGVALYLNLLAEQEEDAVVNALHEHMRDPDRGRFWPRPADVIAKIQGPAVEKMSDGQLLTLASRLGVSTTGKARDMLMRDLRAAQAKGGGAMLSRIPETEDDT